MNKKVSSSVFISTIGAVLLLASCGMSPEYVFCVDICPPCPEGSDGGVVVPDQQVVEPDQAVEPEECTVFPVDNAWNTDVTEYPVHSNSAGILRYIGLSTPLHPDFGENNSGIPYVYVPLVQKMIDIRFFDYPTESDPGPYPVPLNAPVENGLDRHVVAVDMFSCKLYEMYNAYVVNDASGKPVSWKASCGAVFDMRSNRLRPIGWTAADAAGLPIFPGLVRYEEVVKGEINHALRFTVSKTRKAYVLPATHYASRITDVNAPPMGLRLRLKASRDISMFSKTNQVILRALKKYGMFVSDNGGPMYLSGAPSDYWSDDDLFRMKFGSDWSGKDSIRAQDFEVVDTGVINTRY